MSPDEALEELESLDDECARLAGAVLGDEILRLRRKLKASEKQKSKLILAIRCDDERIRFLAGTCKDGPVIEGFASILDDFWNFLGDTIRDRIGDENDSPDVEGTEEDRVKAMRRMIDAAMEAEKGSSR